MNAAKSPTGLQSPLGVGIRPRVYWPVRGLVRLCLSVFYKMEINGLGNLPDSGPFVLLPKHQRWQDIPLLGLATPKPLYYVAKYELFRYRPAEWLLKSLGGIPLNRQRPLESRRYIRDTVNMLSAGEGVVVFPEGTYFRRRMGPGQVGMVRFILARISLPCIPVGIRYWDNDGRIGVGIRFGEPILPDQCMPIHHLMDRIMGDIAGLSGLSCG